MYTAHKHQYLVPTNGKFHHSQSSTKPPKDSPAKEECKRLLDIAIDELHNLQRVLYANNRYSVLLVFQAMDAAGKDSTIRAVMTGVNPAGCQVYSFKEPSKEELDHDFLWRTNNRLPERGRIGIFNRSYYEEVLIVRVHPHFLERQRLPFSIHKKAIWDERLQSIADLEKHLARNGTIILKFWLNVSKKEQKKRFLARLDDTVKNWKFSMQDVEERKYWKKYMQAYEKALRATSKPWAPWYAIPADDKAFMQLKVAEIIVSNLKRLDLTYPQMDTHLKKHLKSIREKLVNE